MIKIDSNKNAVIVVKVIERGGLLISQACPFGGEDEEIVVSADQVEALLEAIEKLRN